MPEQELDEQGNKLVATTEPKVNTPAPQEPASEPKKLQLTLEELDAIKQEAVAAAQQENEERIRREEDEKNGNYKLLAEQAQEELRQTNLKLWRTKALNKYSLPESLSLALVGESEKDIMSCARKLKEDFDEEVTSRLRAEGERITPPDPQGRTNPVNNKGQNADARIKSNLAASLGIGRVQSIRH